MVGAGYLITFDSNREITDVMKCIHGHPVEKVVILREEAAVIPKNEESARGAGTGGHEFES